MVCFKSYVIKASSSSVGTRERYRYEGLPAAPAQAGIGRAFSLRGLTSPWGPNPPRFYRSSCRRLNAAQRVAGNWIIYQEPRRAGGRGAFCGGQSGESIVPDPENAGIFLALTPLARTWSLAETFHFNSMEASRNAVCWMRMGD